LLHRRLLSFYLENTSTSENKEPNAIDEPDRVEEPNRIEATSPIEPPRVTATSPIEPTRASAQGPIEPARAAVQGPIEQTRAAAQGPIEPQRAAAQGHIEPTRVAVPAPVTQQVLDTRNNHMIAYDPTNLSLLANGLPAISINDPNALYATLLQNNVYPDLQTPVDHMIMHLQGMLAANMQNMQNIQQLDFTSPTFLPNSQVMENGMNSQLSNLSLDQQQQRRRGSAQPHELTAKTVQSWSCENVGEWLCSVNLQKHVKKFCDEGVDGQTLLIIQKTSLTEDLKITPMAEVIKIWHAIDSLQKKVNLQ